MHKYEAIELLKTLFHVEHQYGFIAHCVLGDIYNDVEQTNDSVKSYHLALESLSKLDPA